MRIITLNVNGVRSAAKKGVFRWLAAQRADVVCLQEMKCQEADLDTKLHGMKLYQACHAFAEKKGYSGVAIYSRKAPDEVKRGSGWSPSTCRRAPPGRTGRPRSSVS
jgi:exodeoxyribonuclease-3